MRLFISIHLPAELRDYCRSLQKRFPGMKNVEEFHLTLQFLGDDIPEERVPAIIEKLSKVEFQPFEITLGDAVPFGHPKNPHGVWIDCHGGALLHHLADKVRAAMGNLGFLSDKPFAPHLTLGRYKTNKFHKGPPTIPKSIIGEPHRFTVDTFYLMQSYLSAEGSNYKVLGTFLSFTKSSRIMARTVSPNEK